MFRLMQDDAVRPAERQVRLFRNGTEQAVCIPREFELSGESAMMRQENGRLIIEPVHQPASLLALLATLEPLNEEFPALDDPRPEPVEI